MKKKSKSRTLLVMPDDGFSPILEAIHEAEKSIRVKMFLFSHPELIRAVIKAQKRGVQVRVILNAARQNGELENEATRKAFEVAGIEVTEGNPAFEVTHEKSMVVDDQAAYIQSFNWALKNEKETRDYAVATTRPREVEEVIQGFEADWKRKPLDLGRDALLIWCNENGRERIAHFIDEAKHTLFVQNERYQDAVIIERLVRAKQRGVKVHVMARPAHKLKKDQLTDGVSGLRILDDVGIKVHWLKDVRLHGKVLLADQSRAIVGSINLTAGSFDKRRELAIEVHAPEVIHRLRKVVHHDWKHSHPFDLTDEGLRAALEEHHIDASGSLALEEPPRKKR